MSHPLLYHEQAHAIVHQFYALCMPEGVEFEMKDFPFLICNLIPCRKPIKCLADASCIRRIAHQKSLAVRNMFRCWEKPSLGIFFGSVVLLPLWLSELCVQALAFSECLQP